MVLRLFALLALVALVAGCGGEEKGPKSDVGREVADQLKYVDPEAGSVTVVDLDFGGANWVQVKRVADRLLRAFKAAGPPGQREDVPGTLEEALDGTEASIGVKWEEIEPLLDGHLVIATLSPRGRRGELTATLVYRTNGGDVRALAERLAGRGSLKPLRGHPDAVTLPGGSMALVGRKTLVLAFGGDGDTVDLHSELSEILDRAKADRGFPAERLAEAQADTGADDPLVLMAGNLGIGALFVDEEDLEQGRTAVPYLRAIRRGSTALDVTEEAIEMTARVVTDAEPLEERDLPVAPAGELELPTDRDVVAGGNRNQSYTTTFGAGLARALFPESRFVQSVERAERELGIRFEDEVLRQFNCPSVSLLEPPAPDSDAAARFGARSCVADPERMRALLPRLRPYLPGILSGMQGLGDAGLTALLLLAPDAPLVPGLPLAQIEVAPSGGAKAGEELYEIGGLRDDEDNPAAQAGPDRVVFGLIGDAFVVASDEAMARRAAEAKTDQLDDEAGGAIRLNAGQLLGVQEDEQDAAALAKVFGDLVAQISADPEATVAEVRLELDD